MNFKNCTSYKAYDFTILISLIIYSNSCPLATDLINFINSDTFYNDSIQAILLTSQQIQINRGGYYNGFITI